MLQMVGAKETAARRDDHRNGAAWRSVARAGGDAGQVAHVLLTHPPLTSEKQAPHLFARLACIRHAASVRPEPGSNSP